MRILVVEDDVVLADGLKVGLGLHGATLDVVASCADGRAARRADIHLGSRAFDVRYASTGPSSAIPFAVPVLGYAANMTLIPEIGWRCCIFCWRLPQAPAAGFGSTSSHGYSCI